MRILVLLAILTLPGCDDFKRAISGSGPEPVQPEAPDILQLKDYRLYADIGEYFEQADSCFGIEHHTNRVRVCSFKDTLAHQDYDFWLFFIDDKLGRIEARPVGAMFPNDVSRLTYALQERFGEVEEEYGFLWWHGRKTSLYTRIRPPRMAVVTLFDKELDDLIDEQRTETAADDL